MGSARAVGGELLVLFPAEVQVETRSALLPFSAKNMSLEAGGIGGHGDQSGVFCMVGVIYLSRCMRICVSEQNTH